MSVRYEPYVQVQVGSGYYVDHQSRMLHAAPLRWAWWTGCEISGHTRRKLLTISRLQEMLEVRMIEFVSPDKYPRIMIRGVGSVSQYLEKYLVDSY